jgi:16S rRNA (cytidine1402-2'-O)-methyltransferase
MARRQTAGSGKAKRSSVGRKPFSGRGSQAEPQPSDTSGPSKPSDRIPAGAFLAPGLYVVATPIGHASDVTLRALQVLGAVDAIACEDTRVTAKLLAIHGISAPLTPYHDHNAQTAGPALIRRLAAGERIALVSDAGTPLISDPGYRLIRASAEAGIAVVPIPGPSAVLAALCVSGLPTDRFLFAGFPPSRAAARRRFLAELTAVPATLVLMESPRRLAAALADMADAFGPREAVVARELTKLFEEIRRGSLEQLAQHYCEAAVPKGEVTVVVAPPPEPPPADDADIDRRLSAALTGTSVRTAAERVAAETGLPRRRLYARALELRRREP